MARILVKGIKCGVDCMESSAYFHHAQPPSNETNLHKFEKKLDPMNGRNIYCRMLQTLPSAEYKIYRDEEKIKRIGVVRDPSKGSSSWILYPSPQMCPYLYIRVINNTIVKENEMRYLYSCIE